MNYNEAAVEEQKLNLALGEEHAASVVEDNELTMMRGRRRMRDDGVNKYTIHSPPSNPGCWRKN